MAQRYPVYPKWMSNKKLKTKRHYKRTHLQKSDVKKTMENTGVNKDMMLKKWSEVILKNILNHQCISASSPCGYTSGMIKNKKRNETHPGFRTRRGNLRNTKQQRQQNDWLHRAGKQNSKLCFHIYKCFSCWLKFPPIPFFLWVCK